MKFVFAPDSYKGSLKSSESISILSRTARRYFPGCEIVPVIMADGGEGTLEAVLAALNGREIHKEVTGPNWEKTVASYGITDGGDAIIEMSSASGITLLKEGEVNPLKTTTYGTGELIKDALDHEVNSILLCVGGSATNDGGMGAMRALGVRFLDDAGAEVEPIGENLVKVASVDRGSIDKRLSRVVIKVLCDVKNPLCGRNGATFVYGRQKGATDEQLEMLEQGMRSYAKVVLRETGVDVSDMPGAGAAGGLSAAICAFCNGKLVSGAEEILKLVDFDSLIHGADLVVTGEGRLDAQSENGKVVYCVGSHCKESGVKAAAIVGECLSDGTSLHSYGIENVYCLMRDGISLRYSIDNAADLFEKRAEELFNEFLNSANRKNSSVLHAGGM